MRPAPALAFRAAPALLLPVGLLVGCAPVAAPVRSTPEIKAPAAPPTIEGARLVFEDSREESGLDCRGVVGRGGSCFYRVGDGLLAFGTFTSPQTILFIGGDGHVESRQGPLKIAVGGVAYSSNNASEPRLWGRWLNDYFAEAWNGVTRQHTLVRLRGAHATDEGPFLRVLAIFPWTQGRTVGVVKDASGWKHSIWDNAGRHDEPIPGYSAHARLPDSSVIDGEKDDACLVEDLVPWDATLLPSGELVVLGRACAVDPARQHDQLVIDRWSADGTTHALEAVPTPRRPRWASLCASASNDVNVVMGNFEERLPPTVGGGALVATRRAEGWSQSPPLDDPGGSVVQRPYACAVSPDGSTWLNVTHDSRTLEESKRHDGSDFHTYSLVRRPAGGQWATATLPAPWAGVKVIAATPDGSVWLSASARPHREGLLRVGGDGATPPVFGFGGMHPFPDPAPGLLPAVGAPLPPPVSPASPPPPDPCPELFVRFYALDASTLDTYDFPQTRAALEGNPAIAGARFVVAIEGKRRVFGAILAGRAKAEHLVSVVSTLLPGVSPRIECSAPPIQRELKFRAGPR
jgi:hypothetical protein